MVLESMAGSHYTAIVGNKERPTAILMAMGPYKGGTKGGAGSGCREVSSPQTSQLRTVVEACRSKPAVETHKNLNRWAEIERERLSLSS